MSDADLPAIGGYFGLELPVREIWHRDAVALNSGRNALRYLLELQRPAQVHVPVFTCDAVTQVIGDLGINVAPYRIDERMEPVFDFDSIGSDDAFLYTNYFGLKDLFIKTLAARGLRLVIDNAQAFFSWPVATVPTFYSPRKFFGVPDGGYAYPNLAPVFERGVSSDCVKHLLVRHDASAQAGYAAYQDNESLLSRLPIKAMSALTERILGSIDYADVADRRRRNFRQLHHVLRSSNALLIDLDLDVDSVPLSYPYLSQDRDLKSRLHSQNIFTASYWPSLTLLTEPNSLERHYATHIVHLPIDQRYGANEMARILSVTLS